MSCLAEIMLSTVIAFPSISSVSTCSPGRDLGDIGSEDSLRFRDVNDNCTHKKESGLPIERPDSCSRRTPRLALVPQESSINE